jgi:hypothetical protein
MHRLTLFLAALAAAIFLTTGIVVAADPPPAGLGARLAADGAGQAQIDGNVMVAFGLVGGRNSAIVVSDRAGDAKVTLNGKEVTPTRIRERGKLRETKISGANGRFLISGSRIQLQIRGGQISLSTVAIGTARLSGKGTYSLNDSPSAAWNGAQTITLTPDGKRRRRHSCAYCAPATPAPAHAQRGRR